MTVDKEEIMDLIRATRDNDAHMRQVCIDKVISIVDDKLSSHYRLISLETKNLI